MAYSVKIAPTCDEIIIAGDTVSTEFAGGISYTAEGLSLFKEDIVKQAFSTAIALASRPWQIEDSLNSFFRLKGSVK